MLCSAKRDLRMSYACHVRINAGADAMQAAGIVGEKGDGCMQVHHRRAMGLAARGEL